MRPNLFDADDVFVLVTGNDVFPTFVPITLHLWSDVDDALTFAGELQRDDVSLSSVECPGCLAELLTEVADVGCRELCIDGEPVELAEAMAALTGAEAPAVAAAVLTS